MSLSLLLQKNLSITLKGVDMKPQGPFYRNEYEWLNRINPIQCDECDEIAVYDEGSLLCESCYDQGIKYVTEIDEAAYERIQMGLTDF